MKQVLLKTGMVDGVMLYAPGSVDVSVDGTKILFHPNLNVEWFRTGTRVRGTYAAELTYSDGGGVLGIGGFTNPVLAARQGGHTSSESLPSASRSIMSKISSCIRSPAAYPAPPIIACAHAIFSNEEVLRTVDVLVGSTLYDLELPIQSVRYPSDHCAAFRTLGSRSIRIALSMYRVSSLYRCSINKLRSRKRS